MNIVVRDGRSGRFWADNAIFQQPINGIAKLTYLALCRHASSNGTSYPSIALLAKETGFSARSVYRALEDLVVAALIDVESGQESGSPNIYKLLGMPVGQKGMPVGHTPSASGADLGMPVGHTKDLLQEKEVKTNTNTSSANAEVFERFWTAYPKRKKRGEAERAWAKMRPPLDLVLAAIAVQKKSRDWLKEGGQFIPYPASWLNAKGWLDDVDVVLDDDDDGPGPGMGVLT